MKILIVDDESLARERLIRLLSELDINYSSSQAEHGIQALKIALETKPDVILLDIRMPLMDGIEVAQHINTLQAPPAIIFTTAYQDYALDAFHVHAIDYLMKPIRKEALQQALNRARKLSNTDIQILKDRHSTNRTHLTTTINGELKIIAVEDICMLKATQKYVTAFWPKGELLLSESLKSLEQEFSSQLTRIHRNTLVNLKHIQLLGKNQQGNFYIKLKDIDERLPVSRRHVSQVKNTIKLFRSNI